MRPFFNWITKCIRQVFKAGFLFNTQRRLVHKEQINAKPRRS